MHFAKIAGLGQGLCEEGWILFPHWFSWIRFDQALGQHFIVDKFDFNTFEELCMCRF
jgi:hypothetical protein